MGEAARSRLLTLVFTDLVGSTALKRERGDPAAGEPIARHQAHTCVSISKPPASLRSRIHLGEVTERPAPGASSKPIVVEGLAVDVAARIGALAQPRRYFDVFAGLRQCGRFLTNQLFCIPHVTRRTR